MARPEITGKKTTATANRATRGHNRGPPLDDDGPKYRRRPVSADANSLAMSIREFCRLHGISEDQFFKMQREKWGPVTMKVGSRTLISTEAAAEWRREREAGGSDTDRFPPKQSGPTQGPTRPNQGIHHRA